MQAVMLVTSTKLFLASMKEYGGCHILVIKDADPQHKEKLDELLDQVKELLRLFSKVAPKEFPKSLHL